MRNYEIDAGTEVLLSRFDLSAVWQMAFGYKGLPFPAQFNGTLKKPLADLGAKLYADGPTGRKQFMPVWLDGKQLPLCTIALGSQKVIIETPLTGRRGTVKEQIRCEDYKFSIRGLVFGYSREFPEQQIMELKDLYEQNKSIKLESAFTDIFLQDYDVVIKNLTFPEMRGTEHARAFEMEILSDENFDLIIK